MMTELELRQWVIATAKKYVGCREEDQSHRAIIDIYNNHKPLKRGYKVKYTDAWCAAFVSAIAILCEITEIMPTECGCADMIEQYRKIGCWQEKDGFIPKIGDVILYDWEDDGVGDNRGNPDHVGLVCQVEQGELTVIEGNKNDQVAYRKIPVDGKYIRGYGCPDYGRLAKEKRQGKESGQTACKNLNESPLWQGVVTADSLNVRSWAGVEYKTCSFSPLTRGSCLWVCDRLQGSDQAVWYYIRYGKKYGFVHSAYVKSV